MAAKKKPAPGPERPVLTGDDLRVETVDNARAVISLGSERTGLLTQAELQRVGLEIARAVQNTY